jgi:hypothetical protein
MPRTAKAYIALILASGTAILVFAAQSWSATNLPEFAAFLGLTLFASTLKARIPGFTGTISPNFVFLLIGMAAFNFSEVVAASLAAALLQSVWRPKQSLRLVQVLFNAATLVSSSAVAYGISHAAVREIGAVSALAVIVLAGSFYLPLNTALVSIVVSLVEAKPLKQVCQQCYEWVFPYFLVGILLTGLAGAAQSKPAAWQESLLLLPAVVFAYLYFLQRFGHAAPQSSEFEEHEEEELLAVSSNRR